MDERDEHWDLEADVVVLGSGGAALVAALAAHDHGAARVVIVEKSGMVGGTTAMSGRDAVDSAQPPCDGGRSRRLA